MLQDVPMRIAEEFSYPVPPASVRALLTDVAFREEVLAAQKVLRAGASVQQGDGLDIVATEQVQSTDGLPGFVRSFVGDSVSITQVERWNDVSATVECTVPGAPGRVSGTDTLIATATGTLLRVERDITVTVPLVGAKVAELVGTMLTKALHKQDEVLAARLR